MSSSVVARSRSSVISWHVPGDAFLARRLREIVGTGERAGATAGDVAIVATSHGVCEVHLPADGAPALLPEGIREEPGLRDVAELVARCLATWQPGIESLPLDVRGTAFQIEVWRALRGVRSGRTATYGDVARRMGRSPGASRAIGQAVGANPVPVLVPCHRVVAAGGIGGFACGLAMKRRLLLAEGVLA